MEKRGTLVIIVIVIVIAAIACMGLIVFSNTGSFTGYKKAYETNALVCSDPELRMGDEGAKFIIYDQERMRYRMVITWRLLQKGDAIKISVNRIGRAALIDK